MFTPSHAAHHSSCPSSFHPYILVEFWNSGFYRPGFTIALAVENHFSSELIGSGLCLLRNSEFVSSSGFKRAQYYSIIPKMQLTLHMKEYTCTAYLHRSTRKFQYCFLYMWYVCTSIKSSLHTIFNWELSVELHFALK